MLAALLSCHHETKDLTLSLEQPDVTEITGVALSTYYVVMVEDVNIEGVMKSTQNT